MISDVGMPQMDGYELVRDCGSVIALLRYRRLLSRATAAPRM